MRKKNLTMAVLMTGCMVMGITGCSSDSSSSSSSSSSSDATTTAASSADETDADETDAETSTDADTADDGDATSDFDTSSLINVSTREDGSGTRGAFIELFGIEQKDEDGNKVDMTTVDAKVTNSTNVMITTIQGDEYAIGYVSMGSLDTSIVKAVNIDGVEATVENIKSGDYTISRPFNIVTGDDLSDVAQDFIDYILSAEGQAIVEEQGYIASVEDAESYSVSDLSGTINVEGSSSVTPLMEKLAEAYMELNSDITVNVLQDDSSTGITAAIEGTCDIGMASRDLKDEESSQGVTSTVIATDGVAVIVNLDNPIENLTTEQVMNIYTGEYTVWSDVMD